MNPFKSIANHVVNQFSSKEYRDIQAQTKKKFEPEFSQLLNQNSGYFNRVSPSSSRKAKFKNGFKNVTNILSDVGNACAESYAMADPQIWQHHNHQKPSEIPLKSNLEQETGQYYNHQNLSGTTLTPSLGLERQNSREGLSPDTQHAHSSRANNERIQNWRNDPLNSPSEYE